MTTFIYAIANQGGEIRYIGKSARPEFRFSRHLYDAQFKHKRRHVLNWIRSLLRKGEKPVLIILEIVAGNGCEEEIRHIREAREKGIRLTNKTDGGEGAVNLKLSASVKHRLRVLAFRRPKSETARAKISAAGRGRKQSAEWIERRIDPLRGRARPVAVIEKMRTANLGKVRPLASTAKWKSKMSAGGWKRAGLKRRLLGGKESEVARLFLNGVRMRVIGRRFNCSIQSVWRSLNRAGISPRKSACPHCGEQFKTAQPMIRHLRDSHNDDQSAFAIYGNG